MVRVHPAVPDYQVISDVCKNKVIRRIFGPSAPVAIMGIDNGKHLLHIINLERCDAIVLREKWSF